MAKRLPIDLELIQVAFDDRDGDGRWFLDGETGEVLHLNECDDDDLADRIEEGGERYLVIPFQGSTAGYRDMAEFIHSVDDNRLRALLDVAINGKGAFRRFKDVLQDHPQERERWFAFQKQRAYQRILGWLESEDIEPVTSQPSAN
jgi:Uncharacterised protein family (UPF0158)